MHDEDNDGGFPDESPVEVRYPRSKQEERGGRERWPWLPGTIVEQCGPDEWYVCIEVRDLAVLRDGRRAAPAVTSARAASGTARRSGHCRHRAARRRGRAVGRSGERGPGDPLCDGDRDLPWRPNWLSCWLAMTR
jgi:hypothetical protein